MAPPRSTRTKHDPSTETWSAEPQLNLERLTITEGKASNSDSASDIWLAIDSVTGMRYVLKIFMENNKHPGLTYEQHVYRKVHELMEQTGVPYFVRPVAILPFPEEKL